MLLCRNVSQAYGRPVLKDAVRTMPWLREVFEDPTDSVSMTPSQLSVAQLQQACAALGLPKSGESCQTAPSCMFALICYEIVWCAGTKAVLTARIFASVLSCMRCSTVDFRDMLCPPCVRRAGAQAHCILRGDSAARSPC